jgi:hypothetical protein
MAFSARDNASFRALGELLFNGNVARKSQLKCEGSIPPGVAELRL